MILSLDEVTPKEFEKGLAASILQDWADEGGVQMVLDRCDLEVSLIGGGICFNVSEIDYAAEGVCYDWFKLRRDLFKDIRSRCEDARHYGAEDLEAICKHQLASLENIKRGADIAMRAIESIKSKGAIS
jgi:hypothetical protein